MKIALLLPRGGIYRYKTGAFSKGIRYAPLTMPTLEALVPPQLNAQVQIYDEGIDVVKKENITADLVGITSITGASPRAYAYADYFRSKGMTVIMGGVHATLLPDEAKRHADSVVIGPAYETWPQALIDFSKGELKPFYKNPNPWNFSAIPNPDRSVIFKNHSGFITVNSVQAVFGCPNSCDFCVTPVVCEGYHHRPIPDVVNEIRSLKGKHFVFVDPSPIENIKYASDLYTALIPLKKKWSGLATTRLVKHPELMNIMEKSGCKGLLIGFESVSQQSNTAISKGFNNVSDYYILVKELHKRGIAIMGCFVHGLDEDDKDCFERTLEFVNKAAIDLPRFTICTPFPGTPFFDRMKKEGRILTECWSLYDGQHVVCKPVKMSIDECIEGHYMIWKEAYRSIDILKRIALSRCFLTVIPYSNYAYRTYARNLPRFHGARMESDNLI